MSQSAGIDDLQNKLAWCAAGAAAEGDFVAQANIVGWGVSLNPAKQADKFTHDLMGLVPMDLKSIRTQWRESERLFGIPSEYAISINVKDLKRYKAAVPQYHHRARCAVGRPIHADHPPGAGAAEPRQGASSPVQGPCRR